MSHTINGTMVHQETQPIQEFQHHLKVGHVHLYICPTTLSHNFYALHLSSICVSMYP
jgi:hypothetical protein